jgi:hypothetical protein
MVCLPGQKGKGRARSGDTTLRAEPVECAQDFGGHGGMALKPGIGAAIAGQDGAGQWAPGTAMLPADLDLAYAEQLTAEHMVEIEKRSGMVERRWDKLAGRRNEAGGTG